MSESTNSLFPTRAMFNAIGCLLKEPLLIHDGKFRLERNDFITSKQSKFHMILFATIENLVDKGLTTIQPSDMDEYLSKYPEHYQVFNDNDGVEWCYSAIENAQVRNYEVFVEEIKKYSLLRELQAEGLDINEIYPLDNDDDNLRSQFDKMTIDDILKFYEDKINKVSSSYHIGYDRQKSKAGDNGVELYNSFKETPLYGFPTVGKAQNTIFRGMPTKTSMLRSALTNSGKCIVGDSIIFTDKGMIPIEDVINHYEYNSETHEVEAEVISYEEDLKRQVKKTSHWYDMGEHDTIKLTTVHGYEIEGTHEHPVMINRDGVIQWCRIDEVTDEDYLMVSINNQMFGDVETDSVLSYLMGQSIFARISKQDTISKNPKLWDVPKEILMGTKQSIVAFLRGAFDAYGKVSEYQSYSDEGYCTISISSPYHNLINQVQIMLLNLGIVSSKKFDTSQQGISLVIYDISKFQEEVGYTGDSAKRQVIESYDEKIERSKQRHTKTTDTIPSKVKSIGYSRSKVYDFTVPETHSFIANGIISHNTRIAIAEATDLAIGKWYEHDSKHPSKSGWKDKGAKKKVLFISTEMEESELQPTMWAYTSGIEEEEIVDGKLSAKDEQIVIESINHLQECDLFIEYVPKFDPQTINAIVKEYAVKHDIDVVFFDYIHLSFEIMMELSNKTRGMTMREDMMLTIFASGLEELAREYNFHLRTSTQMNGEQTDQTNQMLDQRLLRGAKAMADKMQYGVIMARPTPKELQLVEYHKLFPDVAYGKSIEPNMVYHIYKNRMTKYKGKLWLHIDFGTMRVQELFFTDFQNRQIDVPLTELSEALEE